MSKKHNEDVFFFTLIDFLIQILFFGLVIYVASASASLLSKSTTTQIDLKSVAIVNRWTSTSSIPELAKLLKDHPNPPTPFSDWIPLISTRKLDDVIIKLAYVEARGGISKIDGQLAKAARALGKPSCVTGDEDRGKATFIADFILSDDRIEIIGAPAPQFMAILEEDLKVKLEEIRSLPLEKFRELFSPVIINHSDCRYYVKIKETTKLRAPRESVQSVFLIGK